MWVYNKMTGFWSKFFLSLNLGEPCPYFKLSPVKNSDKPNGTPSFLDVLILY